MSTVESCGGGGSAQGYLAAQIAMERKIGLCNDAPVLAQDREQVRAVLPQSVITPSYLADQFEAGIANGAQIEEKSEAEEYGIRPWGLEGR